MITFPDEFIWGAATSAYQIEGGFDEGGKGPSIWDSFVSIPGKTHRGETGQYACDHFHRFRQDVALMHRMGLRAYRFSISWPRLLPNGRGAVNKEGIQFYNLLIDELLANEIVPWITLYHWDLPLALQLELDGWLNPDMARYFADYADLCFASFGDRVKNWITLNEAWVVSILGHGHGIFAPGRTSDDEPYLVGHQLLRAHAAAVDIYRRKYQNTQKGRIGMANNCDWREPATASDEDIEAAQRALEFFLGWFADPIFKGHYPECMVERLGDRLPKFTEQEESLLKGSADFFGLNHYTTLIAAYAKEVDPETSVYFNGGIAKDQNVTLSLDSECEVTDMNWPIVPWGCRKLLHWIDERYDHPEIILTENGCAFSDEPIDGIVDDQRRVGFLKKYIGECYRAIDNGVKLKGYFVWSFMDNLEWASGYSKRFGIHYVDFKTQKRIPKTSAKWFSEVIQRNGLL